LDATTARSIETAVIAACDRGYFEACTAIGIRKCRPGRPEEFGGGDCAGRGLTLLEFACDSGDAVACTFWMELLSGPLVDTVPADLPRAERIFARAFELAKRQCTEEKSYLSCVLVGRLYKSAAPQLQAERARYVGLAVAYGMVMCRRWDDALACQVVAELSDTHSDLDALRAVDSGEYHKRACALGRARACERAGKPASSTTRP